MTNPSYISLYLIDDGTIARCTCSNTAILGCYLAFTNVSEVQLSNVQQVYTEDLKQTRSNSRISSFPLYEITNVWAFKCKQSNEQLYISLRLK